MKWVVIASNNQVIHWNCTKEKALEWVERYIKMYPEEKGKMHIEEQWW